MTKQDSTERAREAVRKLIARGLITQSEAAQLTGRSRQLIRKWVAGIEWDAARAEVVQKLWKRTFRP